MFYKCCLFLVILSFSVGFSITIQERIALERGLGREIDPDRPLRPFIQETSRQALRNLAEQEAAQEELLVNRRRGARRGDNFDFPANVPPVRARVLPKEHLESDKKYLNGYKKCFNSIAFEAEETGKLLKTNHAKDVLRKILEVSAVRFDDIERALDVFSRHLPNNYPVDQVAFSLKERFEKAQSEATKEFFRYVTPSILNGSEDELKDFNELSDFFCYANKVLSDFSVEEGLFYSTLVSHAAECHDSIPKEWIFDRAKVVNNILAISKKSVGNSSDSDEIESYYADSDEIESSYAEHEFVSTFFKRIKFGFIKHTKFQSFPFERLNHFMLKAPSLFSYCSSHNLGGVEAYLWKKGFSYWRESNKVFWVDPEGIISIRIKNTGVFTVGYLAKNPYKGRLLDRNYLSRESEKLKYSPLGNGWFHPAALDLSITPFWSGALGFQETMGYAHGMIKP